jgi:hypothetical protein
MERRIEAVIKRTGEQIVSNLDDSIQRNTQAQMNAVNAATQEIQQLRDALANTATPEQLQRIDAASQALEDVTTALQGDDTTPAP